MKTAKMTIRLTEGELAFAKRYARTNGLSLTGLIHRYLGRISQVESGGIPREVRNVAGIVPSQVDAKADYKEHLIRKHR